jgi:hypothetical protein
VGGWVPKHDLNYIVLHLIPASTLSGLKEENFRDSTKELRLTFLQTPTNRRLADSNSNSPLHKLTLTNNQMNSHYSSPILGNLDKRIEKIEDIMKRKGQVHDRADNVGITVSLFSTSDAEALEFVALPLPS